ncbi:MAG: DNA-3-methyladenine glycosylase 2 family protein [Bacteriovoracia bacterium]
MTREDVYYEAMKARDHRFDGKFFVGVKTTGIYCRPICPAKPKRQNIEFFQNHIEAERAGYRPCLRCRPESAPESPAWIGKSAVVKRAVKVLYHQDTIRFHEDRFAAMFGVSARHLRRLFVEEIGKTPKQLSAENRLNLARKLLSETDLPISQTAYAAGFGSVRRFNDAFLQRFKKSPGEIRRSPISKSGLVVSLPYRPPFDFAGLLHFYKTHQTGSLEWFEGETMHRVITFGKKSGEVAVSNDPLKSRLLVEINFPDTSIIHAVVSRVRTMFDLDSDPVVVANALEIDPKVKAILKKHPGIRLPSGWDPFEVAISAILGQFVSVERGRALVSDLIELLGDDSGIVGNGKKVKLFPSPGKIAASELTSLKTTGARKRTLRAFAESVAQKRISLEPTQDVEKFLQRILAVPGIGPWTASYMALKVIRHTDAFPETDLILARALELHPKETISRMSPWRGYAAVLFWREYSQTLKKIKTAN